MKKKSSVSNTFPLHKAIVRGDVGAVERMIEAKADLHQLYTVRGSLLLSVFENDDEVA